MNTNNPSDNSFMIEIQPGHLIQGNKYDLVINKVPFRPENLPVPLLRRDMEFIGHGMHPNKWAVEDMYILKFKYGENNYTMVVENTPQNKIYRLSTLSEYIQPGSAGDDVLRRYGINDLNFKNHYLGRW